MAFDGAGPALGAIIDHSAQLVTELSEAIDAADDRPAAVNAGTLLDTQVAHNDDLRTFAKSLRQLSDTHPRRRPEDGAG